MEQAKLMRFTVKHSIFLAGMIGLVTMFYAYVLPGQFPNVQILVDRSYGARVVEAVLDNQADFGITQLPVTEKRLQVVKIHSDEIKVLMPAHHPLALKPFILPEDLIGHPLLMPKTGTTRRRLNVWLESVEDQLNVSMELSSTEMIKRFVMASLGLSFLAGTHCQEEIAAGKLAAVGIGPDPMVQQIALIYRKDKRFPRPRSGLLRSR